MLWISSSDVIFTQGPSGVVREMREEFERDGRPVGPRGGGGNARGALRGGREGVLRPPVRPRRQAGLRRGRREDLPVLWRAGRLPRQREVAVGALRRIRAHRWQEPPPHRQLGQGFVHKSSELHFSLDLGSIGTSD